MPSLPDGRLRYPTAVPAGRAFSVDVRALLEALTDQFPEPLLCIRELVQNAADAGAQRITIEVAYDRERELLRLSVADDGRGMGPKEVEGYLTIGFSEKDPARQRGRFGVGKLSPYALGIQRMVVETSDGETGHRIEFDGAGSGRLVSRAPDRAGTTVRVYKSCGHADAERWARRTFELVEETCGGLPLRIEVNGVAVSDDPVLLEGPYVHVFEAADLRGRLGIVAEPVQRLSSGYILLETGAPILGESVSYALDSPLLSPTLSRNAVRRDAAYDAVVRRARAQVPELERRIVAALTRRVSALRRRGVAVERHLDADDRAAVEWVRARLLDGEPGAAGLDAAPVLETADGDLVSLARLREVHRKEGVVPASRTPRSADEVSAYVDRGVPVLLLYRDVEDFLNAEGLRTSEVEAHEEGREIELDGYTDGERALLSGAPLGTRRAAVVARVAAVLIIAAAAGALAGGLASRAVGPLSAGPAGPNGLVAAPIERRPPEAPASGGAAWPLAGAGALALAAAAALGAWSRLRRAVAFPVRSASPWRWRVLARALRHPRDFLIARTWARRSAGVPSGRGPALEGYRELVPEPEVPVGVRLDLDRLGKGLVDLRGPDGGRSDARVLVIRERRALLNRNHPTVRRLIALAEHDAVRARLLLDALLATDPELARHADPRQSEWDLVARGRARLAQARKRAAA
jgi:hypothetical protein